MIGEVEIINNHQKEYGDYQTPLFFSDEICNFLYKNLNCNPNVIIEPTFGLGNFIKSSINCFKKINKIYGIEINNFYYAKCKHDIYSSNSVSVNLYNKDIFNFDFDNILSDLKKEDDILIIGNPPWVTSSKLSNLKSNNIPQKSNFLQHKGFDAITGKANFDITEYIILLLLKKFSVYSIKLALLCKSSVARNLVKSIPNLNLNISKIKTYEFSAKEIFNVNCDAVLLYIETGAEKSNICEVYTLADNKKIKSYGWSKDYFISNIDKYNLHSKIDGVSSLQWRQGLKHDCSKIFELTKKEENIFKNGENDVLKLENKYIYPLLKSSDLKHFIINKNRKHVIVTQSFVGEPTECIKNQSPLLWDYLISKKETINNRKSIIYKKAPLFSIFGIGNYSFAKYKVAISGFYKKPFFSLLKFDKPVMLDDTCYFLSFDNLKYAQICTILLNSQPVVDFLSSIVFLDSKRPYTKDILMRIDLNNIVQTTEYSKLKTYAKILNLDFDISLQDYEDFKYFLFEQTNKE